MTAKPRGMLWATVAIVGLLVGLESAVDESRCVGMHGTAVLSRYPIASARLLPLQNQGYDWFVDELDDASMIEQAKREAGEAAFETRIGREIRRGGRTLLLVDLDVPDLTEGRVSIAAAHFESRSEPEEREEQLAETLGYLAEIRHPVILAGDMNTSGQDGTPTSWKREVYRRVGDAEFWAGTAVKSNHRDDKGFAVTFEVERTIGPAGKLKLDWIFVRASAGECRTIRRSASICL